MVSHLVFCFFLYRSFLQSGACFNTIWCPCHLKCSHTFSSDKQNFIVGLFVTISLFHNLVFLVSLSLYPFHVMIFHCLDATETLDTADAAEDEGGLRQLLRLSLTKFRMSSFISRKWGLVQFGFQLPPSSLGGPYFSKQFEFETSSYKYINFTNHMIINNLKEGHQGSKGKTFPFSLSRILSHQVVHHSVQTGDLTEGERFSLYNNILFSQKICDGFPGHLLVVTTHFIKPGILGISDPHFKHTHPNLVCPC